MFPQHTTLHPSIAGYQDGVEFFPLSAPSAAIASSASSSAARLVLTGWAFHWREAVRPVRYVCQLLDGAAEYVPLTLQDRPDVAEAYNRVAVRRCGWSQTIVLPAAAVDPDDCPPQWLEMQLRSGEWVKFRDLVTYQDDDQEDNNSSSDAIGTPTVVVAAAEEEAAEEAVSSSSSVPPSSPVSAAAAAAASEKPSLWPSTVYGTCDGAWTVARLAEEELAVLSARVAALDKRVAALERCLCM